MSKVSCEIIKDLLPSYMEEICSEDTKKFVKDHLKECKECQVLIEMMKKTELVSEQTEQRIVDSVKKVKRHIQKIVGLGILAGLFGIGMIMFLEQFGVVPISFYFIAIPIFLMDFYWIFFDDLSQQRWEKWIVGFGIVEFALIGYSVLLEFLCVGWIQNGSYPLIKLGQFLSYQYWISTIIQGILSIVMIGTNKKGNIFYRIEISAGILGMGINLSFLSLLKGLDTLERFMQIRNRTLCIVLVEWVVTVGVLEIVFWIQKKRIDKYRRSCYNR